MAYWRPLRVARRPSRPRSGVYLVSIETLVASRLTLLHPTTYHQTFESLQRLSNQLRDASHHVEALGRALARSMPPAALPNGSPTGAAAAPSATRFAPRNNDDDDEEAAATTAKDKKMSKRAKKLAKKAADPNAPKRPPSAYLVFQNEVRGDMRKRYPDLPYAELLGKISEAWKALAASDKKVYQDNTDEAMKKWNDEKNERSGKPTDGAAAGGDEEDEIRDGDDDDDDDAGDATTAEAQLLADAVTKEKTKKKPGRKSKGAAEAEAPSTPAASRSVAGPSDESMTASSKKRKGKGEEEKKKKSKR